MGQVGPVKRSPGRVHDLRDAHSCMKKKCLEMPEALPTCGTTHSMAVPPYTSDHVRYLYAYLIINIYYIYIALYSYIHNINNYVHTHTDIYIYIYLCVYIYLYIYISVRLLLLFTTDTFQIQRSMLFNMTIVTSPFRSGVKAGQ